MNIEKGSILTNVMDIHGNIHKKIEVINVYENTLCVMDLDDLSRWIVHKINVGLKPVSNTRHRDHFDLQKSQHQKEHKRIPVRLKKRWL